jgi:PBP4 family serine-type D-alanyl-D-alanine carboxypeptidase
MKRVSDVEAAELAAQPILSSDSPELQEILAFTLTWSDNLLAERIARLASQAAGYSLDDAGVAQTFSDVLSSFGIEKKNAIIQDASGLSRDNRITAKQVAELLFKIRQDSKFAALIGGLPVGGVTGTLRHRFIETAPQAVGLIKAKTGTLNGTANLAGYVESGDREYAFVILADRLRKGSVAESRARNTVDRLLGKVAEPLLPEFLPTQNEVSISAN